MKKQNISILIPCHNEEKMISACLFSCLNQTRKPNQVLIVNDGSTDNSGLVLERCKKDYQKIAPETSIDIIYIPRATGNKSRAQEIGLKYIRGNILVTTDGDTILEKNFIKIIEEEFQKDPELSIIAGYVKSTKYNYLTALREIEYPLSQNVYKFAQSCVKFILVIPGPAGAFKTDLFKKNIIEFEHDTLTEDLDFTYKANHADLKMLFNKKAIVYTQDPPTLHSYINQMRRWYGGGWQNLKKHKSVILKKPGAALMLLPLYSESLVFGLAFLSLPFINLKLYFYVSAFYLVISVLSGIYAAFINKRMDLIFYSPLFIFLFTLNSLIFIEQFFKEIVLKKHNMTWFHPERRNISGFGTNLE